MTVFNLLITFSTNKNDKKRRQSFRAIIKTNTRSKAVALSVHAWTAAATPNKCLASVWEFWIHTHTLLVVCRWWCSTTRPPRDEPTSTQHQPHLHCLNEHIYLYRYEGDASIHSNGVSSYRVPTHTNTHTQPSRKGRPPTKTGFPTHSICGVSEAAEE